MENVQLVKSVCEEFLWISSFLSKIKKKKNDEFLLCISEELLEYTSYLFIYVYTFFVS